MNTQSLRARQTISLSLLFAAGLVNILDRASLSVANIPVRMELHLTATQMGWLLSAFSLAYGIAQLPLVGMLDRAGTRRTLGAGLTVWSVAQMCTGFVGGFSSFVTMRLLLGCGESPFFPSAIRSIREWFGASSRGRATALINFSQAIGLAIAAPLLASLIVHWGWRRMFFLLGVAGLFVAALWVAMHRTREETEHAIPEQSAPYAGNPYRSLLSRRMVWGMMLGFSGINYTNWLYITWLPGYLQQQHHLSLATAGWFATIPPLGGGAGMLLSGVVADRLHRYGFDLAKLHRVHLVVGMVASAGFTLAVPHAASVQAATAEITGALFCIHFAGTSGWGYAQAVSPVNLVAGMSALQNFASYMLGSVAPVLTGYILDVTGSFSLALSITAAITALGALSYATLAAPGKETWPETAHDHR